MVARSMLLGLLMLVIFSACSPQPSPPPPTPIAGVGTATPSFTAVIVTATIKQPPTVSPDQVQACIDAAQQADYSQETEFSKAIDCFEQLILKEPGNTKAAEYISLLQSIRAGHENVTRLRDLRINGEPLEGRQAAMAEIVRIIEKAQEAIKSIGSTSLDEWDHESLLIEAAQAEQDDRKQDALAFCQQIAERWPDAPSDEPGSAQACITRLTEALATPTPVLPPAPTRVPTGKVPDVHGADVNQAKHYLEGLGFTNIAKTLDPYPGNVCKGQVTYSDPPKGSVIAKNALIRLFYRGFDTGCQQ